MPASLSIVVVIDAAAAIIQQHLVHAEMVATLLMGTTACCSRQRGLSLPLHCHCRCCHQGVHSFSTQTEQCTHHHVTHIFFWLLNRLASAIPLSRVPSFDTTLLCSSRRNSLGPHFSLFCFGSWVFLFFYFLVCVSFNQYVALSGPDKWGWTFLAFSAGRAVGMVE